MTEERRQERRCSRVKTFALNLAMNPKISIKEVRDIQSDLTMIFDDFQEVRPLQSEELGRNFVLGIEEGLEEITKQFRNL